MFELRTPVAEDLAELTELSLRAKASHGYDAAFMAACRDELTLTDADLARGGMQLAERAGAYLGITQVFDTPGGWSLDALFVDPDHHGEGVGRALFKWATDHALRHGAREIWIDADPGAVAFYRNLGARPAGEVPSGSVPGRMLPQLKWKPKAD